MLLVTVAFIVSLVTPSVLAAPALDSATRKMNGHNAQTLNSQFASLKKSDPCHDTDMACVDGAFAQCVSGKWETTDCAGGTQCFALPLVNKAGTTITCDTKADALARISNTGVSGGLTGPGHPSSLAAAPDSKDGTSMHTSADCNTDAETTVTVTVTESTPPSNTFTRSATLAPGVTLPPGPATLTSLAPASSATTLPLNSTDTDVLASFSLATTITLSPASASALLSSLSAENPTFTVSTISDSFPTVSPETSETTSADAPSSVTAAPAASPTASPVSLAAVATTDAGDGNGYGYRARSFGRSF